MVAANTTQNDIQDIMNYLNYIVKNFDSVNWVRALIAFSALMSVHLYSIIYGFDIRAFAFVDYIFVAKLSVDFFFALAWASLVKAFVIILFDMFGGQLFTFPIKFLNPIGQFFLKFGTERTLKTDILITIAIFTWIYAPELYSDIIVRLIFLIILVIGTAAYFVVNSSTYSPEDDEDFYVPENMHITIGVLAFLIVAFTLGIGRANHLLVENQMHIVMANGSETSLSLLGFSGSGAVFSDSNKQLFLIPTGAIISITPIKKSAAKPKDNP